MIHACEPTLEKLKEIKKELFSADSTDENLKKIHALESQIKRHEEATKAIPMSVNPQITD